MFTIKDLSDNQASRLQHILENEFLELQKDAVINTSNSVSLSIEGESEEERAKQVIVCR